jgi:hypothetical protein
MKFEVLVTSILFNSVSQSYSRYVFFTFSCKYLIKLNKPLAIGESTIGALDTVLQDIQTSKLVGYCVYTAKDLELLQ